MSTVLSSFHVKCNQRLFSIFFNDLGDIKGESLGLQGLRAIQEHQAIVDVMHSGSLVAGNALCDLVYTSSS